MESNMFLLVTDVIWELAEKNHERQVKIIAPYPVFGTQNVTFMSPRQALQFLSGPCMASLRFQHILIDVYLLCKARRLFKFTLLPTPFITLPKVWALDRWTWESEETFWRRRQTSSPGFRKLSSWFCSSLVLPAALRCGKSQSQIKRSNICQGVQFTEQIESCFS